MFTRYAIYFTASGDLAARGAAWLGWDIATGRPVAHPDFEDVELAAITETPRKYGFHGTIKPPFALGPDFTEAQLQDAVSALCDSAKQIELAGLDVARMGRFIALIPSDGQDALNPLAASVVKALDGFRASPSAKYLARRRKPHLSARQIANLERWGYPYVMEDFRFHMTLTGRFKDASRVLPVAKAYFEPVLPTPFAISALTLVGERTDGMFVEIQRFPLAA